jgi:hypothetical protein
MEVAKESFGGRDEELEERFSLGSDGPHVLKCGHLKVFVLEARGTGAANQGVVLLWIPLSRLHKNAAI